MIRLTIAAVFLSLALPVTASAQRGEPPPRFRVTPRTGPPSEGWPRDPLPRFTVPPRGTVALPEIGLPLPPIGLQGPDTDFSRQRRLSRRGAATWWPGIVYADPHFFVPEVYDPRFYDPRYYDPLEQPPEPPPVEREIVVPATGRLILEGQPGDAQVFVDGYYAGILSDFNEVVGGNPIEAGAHRIDISAPGFQGVSFDVNIAADQAVTYRGTLNPLPTLPDQPARPTTFYLIPGCYLGNVHPREVRLPANCDLKKVVERKY